MLRYFVLGLLAALSACATPQPASKTMRPPPIAEVQYLPPLAEITLVTASGSREQQPDESRMAALNLGDALSDAVSPNLLYHSDEALTRALALSEQIGALGEDTAVVATSSGELLALIRVRYDVESSASRLVQGGLGVMFGGVPGPDGIERSAEIVLVDPETSEIVWYHQMGARDPRKPDGAKRLIDGLITSSSQP